MKIDKQSTSRGDISIFTKMVHNLDQVEGSMMYIFRSGGSIVSEVDIIYIYIYIFPFVFRGGVGWVKYAVI